MPTNILMPALSPTMEKGNLARWLKKEGDKIKSGDVIAEIETDKATMEYEAVDDGTLAKIVVPEGTQDVAVNAVIAVLANEGEDIKTVASVPKAAAPPAHSEAGTRARAEIGRREKPAPAAAPSAPRASSTASVCGAAAWHKPHLLLTARAPPCERIQHRPQPRAGLRSARPCHCAGYRSRKIG